MVDGVVYRKYVRAVGLLCGVAEPKGRRERHVRLVLELVGQVYLSRRQGSTVRHVVAEVVVQAGLRGSVRELACRSENCEGGRDFDDLPAKLVVDLDQPRGLLLVRV